MLQPDAHTLQQTGFVVGGLGDVERGACLVAVRANELDRAVECVIAGATGENLRFQRVETSRLQALALAMTEKAAGVVKQNQKLMEQKINATNAGQGVNLDGARKSTTKRDGKDRERYAAGSGKERRRAAANGTEGGERQRRPKQVRIVG